MSDETPESLIPYDEIVQEALRAVVGRVLNAVVELQTRLTPRVLLDLLLEIEVRFGRDRAEGEKWGPRELDLDLLVYGDEQLDDREARAGRARGAGRGAPAHQKAATAVVLLTEVPRAELVTVTVTVL